MMNFIRQAAINNLNATAQQIYKALDDIKFEVKIAAINHIWEKIRIGLF